jgi:hypothetical protein
MSNTNNIRHLKSTTGDTKMSANLPPLSLDDVISENSTVCETVRLYLAVWGDLTPEQRRPVSKHAQTCEQCAYERQLLWGVTRSLSHLPETQPSARVDRAVLDAIAARSQNSNGTQRKIQEGRHFDPAFRNHARTVHRSPFDIRRRSTKFAVLAALLTLALLSSTYFVINVMNGWSHAPQSATIDLPANLSWDKYVLYQEQTMTGLHGQSYAMTSYKDMTTQDANIEVVVPGKMDLVVVRDPGAKESLGLDMMHQLAQWNASDWVQAETSLFELDRLRQYLRTGQATYLGKASYNGQDVYRIRMPNAQVLLLDMNYLPVNVLENVDSSGVGKPVYTALRWLLPSQVPSSTWDMAVPADFRMGKLPSQP